jgi:hypothetical protein
MTAKRGFMREGVSLVPVTSGISRMLYVGVKNKGKEGCDDKLQC